MSIEFDKNKLTRWSRLIRLRDEGICFMCLKKNKVIEMEAHHIHPKAVEKYSQIAYDLDNGITLCQNCHLNIVHTTEANWKKFVIMFKNNMKCKKVKEFNITNQSRIK